MNKNFYIVIFVFLVLTISYIVFNKKNTGLFISKLDNITKVKITSVKGENLLEIDDKKDIKYFLSTFKPSQSNPAKEVGNFKINGYILFMEEDIIKFKIAVDYNYGYSCKINDKDYFQQFTYATHRYLMDIR